MTDKIAHIAFDSLTISPATEWHVLRITDSEGCIGHGEATLGGQAQALADHARIALPIMLNREATVSGLASLIPGRDIVQTAIRSAVDMALREIGAKRAGKTLASMLAAEPGDTVRFYANINRRSHARTPQAFADSARLAIAQGFDIVKIAPFDEVTPERCQGETLDSLIGPARARIEAVLDAISEDAMLRIDCHWRFTSSTAMAMIDKIAEYRPDWIECPMVETPKAAPSIAELRRAAGRHDIQLAGLETATMAASFTPYLTAGSYDVVMPDVKYIGGLDELSRLADEALKAGTSLSLHNPTGPVAHATSLHASAAFAPETAHEVQFDETTHFWTLVEDRSAISVGACVALNPDLFGTGLRLSDTELNLLRRQERSFVLCNR